MTAFSPRLRQAEREILARVIAATHGNDDVLLAVSQVRHRCSALWRRQIYRANLLSVRLVVRAQHRPSRVIRRGRGLRFTYDEERLRDQGTDGTRLAGTGNRQTFERRVIAHDIRCFALGNLPDEIALVQVDRRDTPIGWLEERKSLWTERRSAAPLDGRRRRRGGSWRGDSSGPSGRSRRRCDSASTARRRRRIGAGVFTRTGDIPHATEDSSLHQVDVRKFTTRRRKQPNRRK